MNLRYGLLIAMVMACLPTLAAGYAFGAATPDGLHVQQNQVAGIPVTWYNPQQTFVLNFGGDYDNSAVSAMNEWNAVNTPLQWSLGNTKTDLCNSSDHINSAGWRSSPCGTADSSASFGDAIAITKRSYEKIGDNWYLADTDIIVDNSELWEPSYSGAIKLTVAGQHIQDFRRVILHELGHALGLDHPDDAGQNVTAIMNAQVSNVNSLQQDDKDGIRALYSRITNTVSNSIAQTTPSTGGGSEAWFIPLLTSIALWRRKPCKKFKRQTL